MNFKIFKENIQNRVVDKIGKDKKVFYNSVTKNNGVILTGMVIEDKKTNASPTIYIDDFYKKLGQYEAYDVEEELESIATDIARIYESGRLNESLDIDFFSDFELVSERILFKLINFEKNVELLKEIPYIPYLNLALVFYCPVTNKGDVSSSILIYNKHMEKWKITVEELEKAARKNNLEDLPAVISPMTEVIKDLFSGNFREDMQESIQRNLDNRVYEGVDWDDEWLDDMTGKMVESVHEKEGEMPLFVLTNRQKLFGAACMIYDEVLVDFAQRQNKDLIILPSSIHEVIILPADDNENLEQYLEMVKEINATKVDPEEVLADAIYYYSKALGEISYID